MVIQPGVEAGGSIEHAIQAEQGHRAEGQQFDQRFHGNGHHQPFVFLPGGGMAGAEQDGEDHHHQAEAGGQVAGVGGATEDLDGFCDRLQLQRQQGQHPDQHDQGRHGASQSAAVTEGKQVCQGAELVGRGQPQDRCQQNRGEQKDPGNTQKIGQEVVAVLVGITH